jgi:hypothetical protein
MHCSVAFSQSPHERSRPTFDDSKQLSAADTALVDSDKSPTQTHLHFAEARDCIKPAILLEDVLKRPLHRQEHSSIALLSARTRAYEMSRHITEARTENARSSAGVRDVWSVLC